MDIYTYLVNKIFDILDTQDITISVDGIFYGILVKKDYIYLNIVEGGVVPNIHFLISEIEPYTHKTPTNNLYIIPSIKLFMDIIISSGVNYKDVLTVLKDFSILKAQNNILLDTVDSNRNKISIFCSKRRLYINTDKFFPRGLAEPSDLIAYRYRYDLQDLDKCINPDLFHYILE